MTDEKIAVTIEPWTQLSELIATNDGNALAMFLHLLAPQDTPYTISRLDDVDRSRMFEMLSTADPDLAADLMEHFPDERAAEMIEELDTAAAAAIVDEMDSDEQTDVLAEMSDEDAEAILEQMDPEEADDARARLAYAETTAGGLMITEFLQYHENQAIDEVIEDLRSHADEISEYEVRFLYVSDSDDKLVGVVTLQTLVMGRPGRRLSELMIEKPRRVDAEASLQDVEDIFDRIDYSAIPVVDERDHLLGVVQRAAVQEALNEAATENLMKLSGIVRGEELRSMPLWTRSLRRLMFLLPIMLLMLGSASIIAIFEPTVEQLPIIAAFLPVVAGLCGSGGNQSVGVSLRELSLGLVKTNDTLRVLRDELMVAGITGVSLGSILFLIAWGWQHDVHLAMVVGFSVPVATIFAKCVGGVIPLILRMIGLDPAMASGPLVTTLTDLCSYLTVLLLAGALVLRYLET